MKSLLLRGVRDLQRISFTSFWTLSNRQECSVKMDKLTEIPRSEWLLLRELYKKDWPTHVIGYYTIDNYINWFDKEPEIKNIKIYTLNGDWSDGTYIVVDRYQILFNTLNQNQLRLKTALSLLYYSGGRILYGYVSAIKPGVDEFLEERKSTLTKKNKDSVTMLYYLPKEKALRFEICPPDGITLKPMKEENAVIANELWPFHHPGSLYFLKRLIRLNPNLGAFTNDNEIVAWCFRLQLGSLGTLQVKETLYRKGLGSLLVKAMSKLFAEMGYDICAPVVENNIPSRKMFDKLGFKIIDKLYWNVLEADKPFDWKEEWDE